MMLRPYLLLCATSAVFAASSPDRPQSLRLCHDSVDVYPWVINGRQGLNLVLLQLVEQRLGVRMEFVARPWVRCLEEMGNGRFDGAFAASFKLDRLEKGSYPMKGDQHDPTRMMMMDGYHLYRLKGSKVSFDGHTIHHLDGMVGAQTAYSIVDQLRSMGVKVDDGTRSADDTARKLLLGRVQAVALQTLQGDNTANQAQFAGKLEKLQPALVEKPYYLMLSKQLIVRYGPFTEELWRTLGEVRESAEYKKALAQFR